MKHLINESKVQYKANVHCHTTLSDGKWTPERVKEEYKKRGYAVVAVTDHERLVSHYALSDKDFLFLTAYEAYVRNFPFDGWTDAQAHINFYSKTPDNKLVYFTPNHTKYIPREEWDKVEYHHLVEEREFSVPFLQKMIADAKECGFLACHNHPTWSFEGVEYADAYLDCFAMEIHNYSAYTTGHNEYNEHFYEHQLRHGREMALIAADDNHNAHEDSFGGMTYILSDKLDYGSIISALENREFYASCGPQIFSLTLENGVLRVRTSKAKRICFVNNTRQRGVTAASGADTVTEGEFALSDKMEWVYVEVTDAEGKKAYTRAFFKHELKD